MKESKFVESRKNPIQQLLSRSIFITSGNLQISSLITIFKINNNGLSSGNQIKELSAILKYAQALNYPTEPAPNS